MVSLFNELTVVCFLHPINASILSICTSIDVIFYDAPVIGKRSVRYNRQAKATKSESRSMNMLPYLSNTSFDYEDDGPSKLFSRPVSVILPVLKQVRIYVFSYLRLSLSFLDVLRVLCYRAVFFL